MTTKKQNLTTYRVGELETDVRGLKSDVNLILTNHLPHLSQDISSLRGKLETTNTRVTMGIMVNIIQVVALIIGLVFIFQK